MENYLLYSNRERVIALEKENLELKKDNAILIGVINDYRDSLIKPSVEIPKKNKKERQLVEKESDSKKVNLPLWKLTNAEREVLNVLVKWKGKTISRNNLAIEIWGSSNVSSRMTRLSTIIKKIRSKLEIGQEEQEIIRTNWGEGYQLTKAFFAYYEIDKDFMNYYEKAQ